MKTNHMNACYKCKWSRRVPGSSHHQCCILGLHYVERTEGRGFVAPTSMHPVEKGWFLWPFNFDPVWLEFCVEWERQREILFRKFDNILRKEA